MGAAPTPRWGVFQSACSQAWSAAESRIWQKPIGLWDSEGRPRILLRSSRATGRCWRILARPLEREPETCRSVGRGSRLARRASPAASGRHSRPRRPSHGRDRLPARPLGHEGKIRAASRSHAPRGNAVLAAPAARPRRDAGASGLAPTLERGSQRTEGRRGLSAVHARVGMQTMAAPRPSVDAGVGLAPRWSMEPIRACADMSFYEAGTGSTDDLADLFRATPASRCPNHPEPSQEHLQDAQLPNRSRFVCRWYNDAFYRSKRNVAGSLYGDQIRQSRLASYDWPLTPRLRSHVRPKYFLSTAILPIHEAPGYRQGNRNDVQGMSGGSSGMIRCSRRYQRTKAHRRQARRGPGAGGRLPRTPRPRARHPQTLPPSRPRCRHLRRADERLACRSGSPDGAPADRGCRPEAAGRPMLSARPGFRCDSSGLTKCDAPRVDGRASGVLVPISGEIAVSYRHRLPDLPRAAIN